MVTLEPLTNWNLDYAEDSCALSRNFGDAAAPTLLETRQYAPRAPYIATVLRKEPLASDMRPSLFFGPIDDVLSNGGSSLIELDEYRGVRAELPTTLGLSERSSFDIEDDPRDAGEAALEWLAIEGVFADKVQLATGSMHPALSAMRECQSQLVASWGFDPVEQTTLSAAAEMDYDDRWISRAMRRASRRDGPIGSAYLLFFADAEGDITACRALSPQYRSSGVDTFCEVAVEDGSVTQASNASGEPVGSFVVFGFFTGTVQR
ncbi:hypothetical protein [Aurantiacibacter aquimixticola]|uniref:hypothetical protein n=1 Tax=Aurantiacibacter aquimixticola TaxID=1958945 RepID=UPI00105849B7|nr:hypothetical protein [Aurantiacibacter aquimixticola]